MEKSTAGGVGHSPGLWGQRLLALSGGGGGRGLSGSLLALAAASTPPPSIPSSDGCSGAICLPRSTFLTYLACFLTPAVGHRRGGTPLTGYGGREWLIGLALAVLCTLLGHSLFSWCLKYLSPSYVSAAKL